MRTLRAGIRTGGALLLAVVLAAPSRAQEAQARRPEPVVQPGVVAIRVLNLTACPMVIRAMADGTVRYVAPIDTGHVVFWLHARADTSAIAVEILASPRLCGLRDRAPDGPSDPLSVPLRIPPIAPFTPVQRARFVHESPD